MRRADTQLPLLSLAPALSAADRAATSREALVRAHLDGVAPGILPAGPTEVSPAPGLPGFWLAVWPAAQEARVYRVVDGRVRPWSGVWRGERAAETALQFTRDRLETP